MNERLLRQIDEGDADALERFITRARRRNDLHALLELTVSPLAPSLCLPLALGVAEVSTRSKLSAAVQGRVGRRLLLLAGDDPEVARAAARALILSGQQRAQFVWGTQRFTLPELEQAVMKHIEYEIVSVLWHLVSGYRSGELRLEAPALTPVPWSERVARGVACTCAFALRPFVQRFSNEEHDPAHMLALLHELRRRIRRKEPLGDLKRQLSRLSAELETQVEDALERVWREPETGENARCGLGALVALRAALSAAHEEPERGLFDAVLWVLRKPILERATLDKLTCWEEWRTPSILHPDEEDDVKLWLSQAQLAWHYAEVLTVRSLAV